LNRLRACFAAVLVLAPFLRAEDTLTIAAAANLSVVMGPLTAAYAAAGGGPVRTTLGSSGSLVAQIENGAPIDVFLSADVDYPSQLVKAGAARGDTLRVFARGKLVLWTVKPAVPLGDVAAAVVSPQVVKIAIANPSTAPYGRAATQALAALGVADLAQPKLVVAESVSQAVQFAQTGNADVGFVALSAVLAPALKGKGRWIEVPAALYAPLLQAGVVTQKGRSNPQSARFMAFLMGSQGQGLLRGYGYEPAP
jgi:molybdate transport system substrate-binding protein